MPGVRLGGTELSSDRARSRTGPTVGLASEADAGAVADIYASLLAVLELQGFVNAYAAIVLPNSASVGLHESVGFEPVAVFEAVGYKHGAWRDVGWWHRALADGETDPDPPQALQAVRGSAGWEAAVSAGEAAIER